MKPLAAAALATALFATAFATYANDPVPARTPAEVSATAGAVATSTSTSISIATATASPVR